MDDSQNKTGSILSIDLAHKADGFSLELSQDFEFEGIWALFGPSGSGKTTILRLIAGLEETNGSIRFNDQIWNDGPSRVHVPAHKRGVGLVFQDARLFDHLNVEKNLSFAMKAAGFGKDRWDSIIAALDLKDYLARSISGLSGGEKQRVALGRALLANPKLLLLDEPLGALDGRRKLEILPYLQRLSQDFQIPTLFVSHSIDEVMQLASHVTLLEAGRIVASGRTREMMERTDLQSLTGRFEAGTTLQAEVVEHEQSFKLTRLVVAGQRLTMPIVPTLEIGQTVPVRLRARDVALSKNKLEGISIQNQLEGVIAEIHPEPNTAFVEVVVDLNGARVQSRITRFALSELSFDVGSKVVVLVKSVAFDRRGLMSR